MSKKYYAVFPGQIKIDNEAFFGIDYKITDFINELMEQNKKQQEVIDDYKEDISNLLDIIGKNCNKLECTSDEWLVIQKYQNKEVSE